ncbi:30S ribosomal protein S4 [Candidatus Gracilibacteria bacterium]|nr:30S ribosomal protein S4 [Candidatus Gracilibacteria bacterium]
MSRYTGPVTRISRRLGVMLFSGKGKSKEKAFLKKNYKPGEHGQKRFRSKPSEYSKQLQEKQKARFLFGISEKQSKKYFVMAAKSDKITGAKYLEILETRLDNVLYRAGIGSSRPQARQMASHGLIKLNGKRIKTPSILVKTGDTFEVVESKKGSKLYEENKNDNVKAPKWLKVDLKNLKGEVIAMPQKDDIEQIIEHQLITEFYSK